MASPIYLPQSAADCAGMLKWATDRLDDADSFGPDAFPIAVMRGGVIAAVCVYHSGQGCNLMAAFASDNPKWATKETLTFLISWPFIQLPDVHRLSCVVRVSNKRSRRLCDGVGWRAEGRHADWFTDPVEDGISYGLTRRWWEQRSRWRRAPELRKAA